MKSGGVVLRLRPAPCLTVNLKVFNPRKTVLLFVIRDKSRTPLAGGAYHTIPPLPLPKLYAVACSSNKSKYPSKALMLS